MKSWEALEIKCYEYLVKTYEKGNLKFCHQGGVDSTRSDIAVLKEGKTDFFIEVKSPVAQAGQFVVIPHDNTERFIFSSKNHSNPNEWTDKMIKHMNRSFQKFKNEGTAGVALDMNPSVFSQWIVNYYEEQNIKYIMTLEGKNNYIIFPTRKLANYFDISAKYRVKKSGSRQPAKKDTERIKQEIKNLYSSVIFINEDNGLFVKSINPIKNPTFSLDKYTYYLSPQSECVYEVRRLSNTHNSNVIFSIRLKKEQDPCDLLEFESDIL